VFILCAFIAFLMIHIKRSFYISLNMQAVETTEISSRRTMGSRAMPGQQLDFA
jgi:hypothetical protein